MGKPNFLCIGAQKSGTTWLYANLAKHPEVWTPPIKEFHYFNRVCINEKLLGHWGSPIPNSRNMYWQVIKRGNINELRWLRHYYRLGLEKSWYLELFDNRFTHGKVCGDMTPGYSTLDERGVRYVKSVIGAETPVLFTIRNPIHRSWSAAKMLFRYRGLAVDNNNADELKELLLSPTISLASEYTRIIPLWQKHFDNFHVLTYDELSHSPDTFLTKISEIIGIKDKWATKTVNKQVWTDAQKISPPPAIGRVLIEQYNNEISATAQMLKNPHVDQWQEELNKLKKQEV